MYPIKYKPKSFLSPDPVTIDYNNIFEIEDMVNRLTAANLIKYALDENASGLHRRQSNVNDGSEFSTCQVHYTMNAFGYDNKIYSILEHAWTLHASKIKNDISFIEPYEIKIYKPGDYFSLHHDGSITDDLTTERKVNLIIQLSDSNDYEGGDLYVADHHVSRAFGSCVFFPANYPHNVTKITRGNRICLIGRSWGPRI